MVDTKRRGIDANVTTAARAGARSRSGVVRVAILLPPRCWAGSVHLPRELLLVAGTLGTRSEDVRASAAFDVVFVGASMRPVRSFGGASIRPDATVGTAGRCDVVVVPAQFAPTERPSAEETRFVEFLKAQHARGALLVSLGGTLLLARTGLLDGEEATGLVSERALIARCAPRVRYVPSRRVVARGDVVTVCGIGPTVDACAHVIERFRGPALARRFLRHTSTETLPAQEQLGLWSARWKQHHDASVRAAQEIVERELHRLPDAGALAARVGLGARALTRRWVEATGMDLRRYVATLRTELAALLLRTTDLPLEHVADECGYSGASALCRAFAERFGEPPARYRVAARRGGAAAA